MFNMNETGELLYSLTNAIISLDETIQNAYQQTQDKNDNIKSESKEVNVNIKASKKTADVISAICNSVENLISVVDKSRNVSATTDILVNIVSSVKTLESVSTVGALKSAMNLNYIAKSVVSFIESLNKSPKLKTMKLENGETLQAPMMINTVTHLLTMLSGLSAKSYKTIKEWLPKIGTVIIDFIDKLNNIKIKKVKDNGKLPFVDVLDSVLSSRIMLLPVAGASLSLGAGMLGNGLDILNKAISKMPSKEKVNNFGKVIKDVLLVSGIIVAEVALIGALFSFATLGKGFVILTAALAGTVGLSIGFSKLLGKNAFDDKKSKQVTNSLMNVAKALLISAGVIAVTAGVGAFVAAVGYETVLTGIGSMFTGLVATALLMWGTSKIIDKLITQKNMSGFSQLIWGIGLSTGVLLIAAALNKVINIEAVMSGLGYLAIGLGALVLISSGIAFTSWIINKLVKPKEMVLTFGALALSMMLAVGSMWFVTKVPEIITLDIFLSGMSTLLVSMAGLTILSLAFAGIGWLGQKLWKQMLVGAGVIVGVSAIIMLMSKVLLPPYFDLLDRIHNMSEGSILSGTGTIAALVLGFGGIITAIGSLTFLLPVLAIGGAIMLGISGLLYVVTETVDNYVDLIERIKKIGGKKVFDDGTVLITDTIMPSFQNIVTAFLDMKIGGLFGPAEILAKGATLKSMMEPIHEFIDIIGKMANLQYISGYDSKGNPIYKPFKAGDFKLAADSLSDGFSYFIEKLSAGFEKMSLSSMMMVKLMGDNLNPIIDSASKFVNIVQQMLTGKYVDGYDENGKPIYTKFTDKDFKAAGKTIAESFGLFISELGKGLDSLSIGDCIALKIISGPLNEVMCAVDKFVNSIKVFMNPDGLYCIKGYDEKGNPIYDTNNPVDVNVVATNLVNNFIHFITELNRLAEMKDTIESVSKALSYISSGESNWFSADVKPLSDSLNQTIKGLVDVKAQLDKLGAQGGDTKVLTSFAEDILNMMNIFSKDLKFDENVIEKYSKLEDLVDDYISDIVDDIIKVRGNIIKKAGSEEALFGFVTNLVDTINTFDNLKVMENGKLLSQQMNEISLSMNKFVDANDKFTSSLKQDKKMIEMLIDEIDDLNDVLIDNQKPLIKSLEKLTASYKDFTDQMKEASKAIQGIQASTVNIEKQATSPQPVQVVQQDDRQIIIQIVDKDGRFTNLKANMKRI